jgi:hypothetical protein
MIERTPDFPLMISAIAICFKMQYKPLPFRDRLEMI